MTPCPACGFANPSGMKFCGECGARLASAAPAAPPSGPRPVIPAHLAERLRAEQAALEVRTADDGERKTITALFADIKGSMELIEDLDPEEARRIVDPALQRMIDAVHRYEGYVAQSTGDGIFALFGAPIAHEDHAQRAVFAALRIQEDIADYADRLRREMGINFQVRVGLNSGEVVLRSIRKDDLHADYVPVGHSTGLAARMQSLAPAGGIVVSEATYRLTEGYFVFKPLGPARIKGVSEPVEIYEVAGIGAIRTRLQRAARRGLTRFVGRQRELHRIREVLDLVRQGRGQIISVAGEAGVGKSRLTLEIKATAGGWLVLETAAVSYGTAYPYLPVIELLKQYCEITADDNERRRREKVTGKVLTLDRGLEDALPFVFALLGLASSVPGSAQSDPAIVRRRTLDALARLFLREAKNQPMLLIVEDLHWLDNESQAFLDALSGRLGDTRLCLLVNYRPEYRHSWSSGTGGTTALRLDPLGQEDAAELLAALLGDAPGLDGLKRLILEKTGGNPFFMEELVQSLLDEGALQRDASGPRGAAIRLARPVTQIHVPASVQAVLAARIDRLASDDRALLQTLAVIGKRFSLGLVEGVEPDRARELPAALARLRSAEFIYEEAAFPEPEYAFKHALTQEVAYGSQLSERRRMLHEHTARALESLHANALDEHAGALAHHYSLSGNAEKAVHYLQLAAQQALQHSAHTEAVQHLTAALPLLATLPETNDRNELELMLQVTLGRALMLARGWEDPTAEHAFTRARELCEVVGGSFNALVALGMLFGFYVARSDFLAGHELAQRMLEIAESVAFPGLLRVAHYMMGQVSLYLGSFLAARRHLEQSAAFETADEQLLYASLGVEDLGVGTATLNALTLWHLGYPDQALQQSEQALAMARPLSHAFTLAGALLAASQVRLLRGEGNAAQTLAEALISHSAEHGLLHDALGRIVSGCAVIQQGRLEEGVSQMRQGLEQLRIKGATFSAPALGRLADALGRMGHIAEAFEVLRHALDRVAQTHEGNSESALQQVKGELLLRAAQDGATKETAEDCLQRALAIARQQQAKSLELAAATSLARLWQQQGRRTEARQLLEEIYGWFSEGFETADLRAARSLLDELQ